MAFVLFVGYFAIVIVCTLLLYLIGKGVYVHFLGPPVNLKDYGEWAVVTGATDGIGKGYAIELAKYGLSVLIVGRNKERLRAAVQEIEASAAPGVVVESFEMDFGLVGVDDYEVLAEKLSARDVGILVNNVGVCYSRPEHLHMLDNNLHFLNTMIKVNCVAATLLSSIVLQQMVKKNRGAIVNISSSMGAFHAGYMTVYCASKAYINSMTASLQQEYGHTKIDIQCVTPFYVASKMSKIRKPSLFVPTSDDYAKEAVKTIGKVGFTYGYPTHSILGYLLELVVTPILSHFTTKRMIKVRKIYMAKNGKAE